MKLSRGTLEPTGWVALGVLWALIATLLVLMLTPVTCGTRTESFNVPAVAGTCNYAPGPLCLHGHPAHMAQLDHVTGPDVFCGNENGAYPSDRQTIFIGMALLALIGSGIIVIVFRGMPTPRGGETPITVHYDQSVETRPLPSEDPIDRLERLAALRDAGAITDEEFAAAKRVALYPG